MSRPDKATTERHAKVLRELVKQPDNKVCADCKRNDPRWASWNLGVFLCIRCSGIHRGMGTHISKVKSVDLDKWTPEQMESIQKWGNRLANLYWEAHLKAGHIPPDHKMESFIRSKYESRRWAMEGPPPSNPSVLDGKQSAPPPAAAELPTQQPPPRSTHTPTNSLSSRNPAPPVTTRQPQGHQLLSAGLVNQHHPRAPAPSSAQPAPPAAAAAAPTPPKAPENDLFSLDFHAPASVSPSPGNTSPTGQVPKKDVKQDILSLFSTPAAPHPAMQSGFGQFGGMAAQTSPWAAAPASNHTAPTQSTSMMGNTGVGMWGVNSGWGAAAPPAQPNVWANPTAPSPPTTQQPNLFASSNDMWGGGSLGGAQQDPFGSFSTAAPAQKKDDVFGDIWGGFK
ncbi:stromal membrane-associated protein [Moniliophthora roreri MCA 2997]|uniref:Stromal membrane-associated protein n=2 Tax=Moniliophthora roreri TaxID=221103 RepID=V2XPC2_MONRO|nr:stromal membrane-associated protein [Moniliophthora roreri MCA 2997]KAI3611468.1 stromal membrane-associated protein [Moniliophthora roreri]